MGMSVREVQTALRRIGFVTPVTGVMDDRTHEDIEQFQRGHGFWWLQVDGFAGPRTERALAHCIKNDGRCSPHFKYSEFKSKGNGRIKLNRALVLGLEELRGIVGPIGILSGYRDPHHNDVVVKAVPNSQHKYGNGMDPSGARITVAQAKSVKRFSGIGIDRGTGLVRHLDVRHKGPNTTNSSVENPAIWFYG